MTKTTNAGNVRPYKNSFYLTVEQILAFTSSTDLIREVENLSPSFKPIIMMFYVIDNPHSDS